MLVCRECELELDPADAQWSGNVAEWVCPRVNCGTWNYLEYVEDTYDA